MLHLLFIISNIIADTSVYQNYGEIGNLLSNPVVGSSLQGDDLSNGLIDALTGNLFDAPNLILSNDLKTKDESNKKSDKKEDDDEDGKKTKSKNAKSNLNEDSDEDSETKAANKKKKEKKLKNKKSHDDDE